MSSRGTGDLCGVLNLCKPSGMTSRDVVNRVMKLVRPAKAGHAGTLDPLATGVLVVCIGPATRLVEHVQRGEKRYRGRFRLGVTSDTDDITGAVRPGSDWQHLHRCDLEQLLPEFTGLILQRPPDYSAIHVQGQRAYHLARQGHSIDLAARPIQVDSLVIAEWSPPDFVLEIVCGSGTYVRSLGRDIGVRLGCGAIMTDLVRTGVGPFQLEDALCADALTFDSLLAHLQPALAAVSTLPRACFSDDELTRLSRGQLVKLAASRIVGTVDDSGQFACCSAAEELMGLGEVLASGDIQPRVMFPRTATAPAS